ncbi:VOC family protein [Chiayiivirga flava]|uniref:PhnB protein n=1 Tax=Chiayiivirga flava TaxID=659595 RepID=A0A7W8D6U1_9GAMM|nr:VOC family protein [Chiayiivirga flava]MBB5207767.1 PhnB protein [Chiayiivirga flava]
MKLVTYLNFDGNTEEAMTFYAGALGARITAMMRFGDTPAAEHVPADAQDKVMHACLQLGDDMILFACDSGCVPGQEFRSHEGFSIAISTPSIDETERVFAALSAGGTVTMPLEKTFWAERFGSLVDRFGVSWLINCDLPT